MSKRPLHSISRRRFIQSGSSGTAAFGLLGCSTLARAESERPTASDSLGPFFVDNMPVVENLNRHGKSGELMRITGRVMDAESPEKPVSGAKLALWQTDGSGKYYPQGNGDAKDYADKDLDMRGTIYSQDDGVFTVMSLFPAEYWPRPSHIHYKISAPGYHTLVTQHYLDTAGDKAPYRSARVDRSVSPAVFPAPVIYLLPA